VLTGGSHCPCSRAINTSVQDAHVLCSRPVFIGIVCTDPWPRRGDISRIDLVRAPLTSTEVDLQREPPVVTTCILIAKINCDINCHDHLCMFAFVNSAITKNCFVVCRIQRYRCFYCALQLWSYSVDRQIDGGPQVPTFVQRSGTLYRHHSCTTLHF